MNKKMIWSAVGVMILGLIAVNSPTIAATANQIFSEKVVFQKVINVQAGIKNTEGKVKVNDDLRVTGNITGDLAASNVVLGSGGGTSLSTQSALDSDNLQDALNEELAINFSQRLPGTTWDISNTTNQVTYADSTGQITFVDEDTATIDTGSFAAAGLNADDEFLCAAMSGTVHYEVVENKVLYLSWSDVNSQDWEAFLPILASNVSSLSVIGSGGCPSGMHDSLSSLTLVE